MAETLRIRDMPISSRPREAFMRSADPCHEISDAALLAILIRTGRKGSSAIDIANRLIRHFGSMAKLLEAGWQQILAARIPGIGKVAAVQLAAVFVLVRRTVRTSHRSFSRAVETPADVVRQVRSIGVDGRQEHVFVLYLDSQRRLLCEPAVIFRGSATGILIHPREIFRDAIRLGAVSIVVAHNHPGGDANPSEEDIVQTKRLVEVSRCVGIPLDDHVVIAHHAWVSLRELGLVDFKCT